MKANSMTLFDKDDLVLLYRNMVRGRKFDQTLIEMCQKNQMPGMWHSGVGHEAVQSGMASLLRRDDWLGITHRGITSGLAKGLDAKRWLAETLGRATGYAGGKSRKSADREIRILPGGGTIGSVFPIATGAAIAMKNQDVDSVVACLFGDGAAQRGTLHECMNMASAWKLPVVWVCENNSYSITTHASRAIAVENIADFAFSYDMPGVVVDGQDVIAVAEAVLEAVQRARKGEGPSLIECKTYRFREHGEFDITTTYRSKDEIEQWKKRDPIRLFRERLLTEGTVSVDELDMIDRIIDEEVAEVSKWALASPEPEPRTAHQKLYRK